MSYRKSFIATFALVTIGLLFSQGAWAGRSLFTSPPSGSSGSDSFVGWLWSGCWDEVNAPSDTDPSKDKGGVASAPFNEAGDSALECTELFGGGSCDSGLPGKKVVGRFALTKFGKPGVPHLIQSLDNVDFTVALAPAVDLPLGIQLVTNTRNAGHYIVNSYADNNKTLVLDPSTGFQKSEVVFGALAPNVVQAKITRLLSNDPAKVCARLFNDDGTTERRIDNNKNQEGIGQLSWESLLRRNCAFKVDPDTGEVDFDRPCTVVANVHDTKANGDPQGGTLRFPFRRRQFDDPNEPLVVSHNFEACDGQQAGNNPPDTWQECGQDLRVPDGLKQKHIKKFFFFDPPLNEGDTFTCTYNAGGQGISNCELRYCNTNLMLDPGGLVNCDFVATAEAIALAEVVLRVDKNLNPSSTESVLTANIDNSEFILTQFLNPDGSGVTLVIEGVVEQRVDPFGTPTFNPHGAVYKFNNREIICAYDKSRHPDEIGDVIPDGTRIDSRLEGLFPGGGGLYGRDFTMTNGGDFDPSAEGAC